MMFMIADLIESSMGKLIFVHLIGNSSPEFHNRLLKIIF